MILSDYLADAKIDDAAFAVLCKVDRSTVSRWRRCKTRPTADQIVTIESVTRGAVRPNDWFEPAAVAAE